MMKSVEISEPELNSCTIEQRSPNNDVNESSKRHRSGGWTGFLIYCNLAIVIGSGFTFGYNLSVVNGPFLVMSQWLNETFEKSDGQSLTKDELNTQWSLAVSIYLIGGIFGSTWFPNVLSSRFGKRNALIFGAVIGAIGEMILFISRYTGSYVPFLIGRVVTGFQGGLSMVIAPGLVNEQAPARLQGACGTMFCLGLTSGVQTANFLGLSFILGSEPLWHYLFLFAAFLYLIHGTGLFFCVESPRWLFDRKKDRDAIRALTKLRNADEEWLDDEIQLLRLTSELESTVENVSVMTVFRKRELWWPMIVAINVHITNQFTGFTAVLIYATMVLNEAGLGADEAALANFGITFATITGNVICGLAVDRIGRRRLLLSGTLGMTVVNVVLVVLFYFNCYQGCIAGFAIFLIFFGYGPGPIPWFMPAEMFNQAARPLALAVTTFTNWVGNYTVGFVFPIIQFKFGFYSFMPFAVIGLLEFVFLLLYLPETTPRLAKYGPEMFAPGKSLIQFRKNNNSSAELSERIRLVSSSNITRYK